MENEAIYFCPARIHLNGKRSNDEEVSDHGDDNLCQSGASLIFIGIPRFLETPFLLANEISALASRTLHHHHS